MFTRTQIEEIIEKIALYGRKDSELPQAIIPLTKKEEISFVQNGRNVKMKLDDLVNNLLLFRATDFINISEKFDNKEFTLTEAVSVVAPINRKAGAFITFIDSTTKDWAIYQFKGNSELEWLQLDLWNNVLQTIDNHFKGYFVNEAALEGEHPMPTIGDYAFVGTTYRNAVIYKCITRWSWSVTSDTMSYIEIVPKGDFEEGVVYDKLNMVFYDYDAYISLNDNNTSLPTDSTKWFRSTNLKDLVQNIESIGDTIVQEESERASAEIARVSAEEQRVSSETTRGDNEVIRQSNEQYRQQAESLRETEHTNKLNEADTAIDLANTATFNANTARDNLTDQVDSKITEANNKILDIESRTASAISDTNDATTAANTAAGNANDAADAADAAAGLADTARLAIQDDLALKADQTELDQLAGDVEQLAYVKIKNEAVNGNLENGLIAPFSKTDGGEGTSTLAINSSTPISGNYDVKLTITTPSTLLNRPMLRGVHGAGNIGDKIYLHFYAKILSGTPSIWSISDGDGAKSIYAGDVINGRNTRIIDVSGTSDAGIIYFNSSSVWDMQMDNFMRINLTETFGAGNEPTEEEMNLLISTLGIDYFEGETTIPSQKVMQWQLKLVNTSAQNADDAREAIQSDLALKADQTELDQLAVEVKENNYIKIDGTLYQGVPYNHVISTLLCSDTILNDGQEIWAGLSDYANFKFRFIGSDTENPTTTTPASAYYQEDKVLDNASVLEKPYVWVQILRVDGGNIEPTDVTLYSYIELKEKIQLIDAVVNTGKTVYVSSATGSDSNDGSFNNPFATIGKAITLLSLNESLTVVASGGTYRETINLSGFSKGALTIKGKINETVRILGSDQITGWILTSGKTNVYETSFAGDINSTKPIIYEDGRQSLPILEGERHALQKSNTHRLPYSKITPINFNTDLATTLNDLENGAGKYYHDVANDTLYIHTTDSDSPLTNGYSYEYAVRVGITSPPMGSVSILKLTNLSFYFSNSHGINLAGFGEVERQFVTVMGSVDNGIQDSSTYVISHNDEVADTRDGLAGTNALTGNNRERNNITYIGAWSHDNSDDGTSHHSKANVKTIGCLFEYNGKSGIAPSNTCQWTDINSICRKNGGNPSYPLWGEGVEVINPILTGDNGIGCTFTGFGTICEGNRIGFGARNSGTVRVHLYGCVSRNNTDAEYYADDGKMYANNCKATNADPLKLKVESGTGTITVSNDEQLI